jgi:LDH2 family malate/lactate/ureidoglycolate dehydrogenase
VNVPADALSAFVARLFAAAGVPPDAAQSVADGLVDADLEGLHSHGVMLVDMYIERLKKGSVSRAERAAIVSERNGAVVLDAVERVRAANPRLELVEVEGGHNIPRQNPKALVEAMRRFLEQQGL